jgi:hypothetical protein
VSVRRPKDQLSGIWSGALDGISADPSIEETAG